MLKKQNAIIEDENLTQEKCGIVAVYTPKLSKKLPLTLSAAGGVQHRGLQGVGMVAQTKKGFVCHSGNGLLSQVFTPNVIKRIDKQSIWTIIHCRYGTHGSYDERNLQPCIITTTKKEIIAVAHNGEFVETHRMRAKITEDLPEGISDTYLFAKMLSSAKGSSWEDKLVQVVSQVKGAYNLVIGIDDVLYVVRDKFGMRPLYLGEINGGWIVASETHALNKIDAKIIREFKRGEVCRIDRDGIKTIYDGQPGKGHFCDFEWAYFSRPDSLHPTHEQQNDSVKPKSWLSVGVFRERCGKILAEESPIPNATFAVGAPDSGVAVTTGYANGLGIPYRQVIIRDHFDLHGSQRLFMRDDEKEKIGSKVLGKISIINDKNIWKEAIVVVGDDSIVRGNVTKQVTRAIFLLGAKEVHWIIGFPPVMHRCHLGVSIRTDGELIAAQYKGDAQMIAKEIGATSVHYISHRGFLKARLLSGKIMNPKKSQELFLVNGGCGGCVTGHYPVTKEGILHKRAV